MSLLLKRGKTMTVHNEYDPLKSVIVCPPLFMKIHEVINETQKHFIEENINRDVAIAQHQQFVQKMEEHGVEVISLPAVRNFPEQVFTRDIGFTLGSTIFISEMESEIRRGEEQVFKSWLEKQQVKLYDLKGQPIEGGDVIIDGRTIYVGISNRTTKEAIDNLQTVLPDYEVIPVPFTEKYLHLDCVFNILSPSEALIFPGALERKEYKMFTSRFDCIEVTEEEQFTLGTNVLSIGDKKVFSLPVNKNVNSELRKRGYEVIEVDISEIIKSGGSFRCCTLPILRDEA
ncbi:dimethylarginine dimethylaminohydrolase family protein [Fictibacillus iocasae]|uniref:Dimethylarginine dimethylaminohydrolase family protein n=1 Tax=Fictibacillus iocasae TaxID=2715437 RepID=A0ABW2NLY8_9BACL